MARTAKIARELHFATVITNGCNDFITKRKMKKITNTQKNTNAENNNDGDFKSLSANMRIKDQAALQYLCSLLFSKQSS